MAEAEAQERAQFEVLVSSLATQLIAPAFDQVQAQVTRALSALGRFTRVDRSFLFRPNATGDAYELICEYAAEGLAPMMETEMLRRLPRSLLPKAVLDRLTAREVVVLPQTRGLFGAPLQQIVDARATNRGVLLLPILAGTELAGIVGLSSSQRDEAWPAWQVDLLRILAEGLVHALERAKADAEREDLLAQERRARAEADMSHELVAGMVERVADPFMAVDPEGRVVYVNRKMLEAWGRTAQEVLGVPWQANTAPEVIPAITDALKTAHREGRPHTIEQYLPRSRRWWALQFFPSGRGTSCLFTDISSRRAAEQARDYLADEIRESHDPDGIVGEGMAPVLEKLLMVAPSNAAVLITGETGTGKELVARAIHNASPRRARVMVKVNCAAVSAGLVESELFGHEKGAFTGAHSRRIGRFEVADGGTLFLDEVGELPLETQAKLLRVLQEGELERVGNSLPIKVDVRVVAATNRDLEAEVKAGRFRSDLLFRLNVFPIAVPPLRTRRGDIADLAEVFLRQEARKLGKSGLKLSRPALEWLEACDWPGNVRELQNTIARSCIVARGPEVTVADLEAFARPHPEAARALETEASPKAQPLKELERDAVLRALEASKWVLEGPKGAAARLGLHPNTLRSRLKKLKIQRPGA